MAYKMGCGLSKKTPSSIDFVIPQIFQGNIKRSQKIKIPKKAHGGATLISIDEVEEGLEYSTSYT